MWSQYCNLKHSSDKLLATHGSGTNNFLYLGVKVVLWGRIFSEAPTRFLFLFLRDSPLSTEYCSTLPHGELMERLQYGIITH